MPRSFVTVHGPPERVASFERVFGSTTVPVLQLLPAPVYASLPIGRRLVYELDVDALSGEQRRRLIEYAAGRFGIPIDEAEAELEHGFPILADDCSFTTTSLDFALDVGGCGPAGDDADEVPS